jgi:Family of unknown function (DUF6011)
MRCLICGRALKSPESLARQIGPVCESRLHPTQKVYRLVRDADISSLDEARQYKLDFTKVDL